MLRLPLADPLRGTAGEGDRLAKSLLNNVVAFDVGGTLAASPRYPFLAKALVEANCAVDVISAVAEGTQAGVLAHWIKLVRRSALRTTALHSAALDLDHRAKLVDFFGRPVYLLSEGDPIAELI